MRNKRTVCGPHLPRSYGISGSLSSGISAPGLSGRILIPLPRSPILNDLFGTINISVRLIYAYQFASSFHQYRVSPNAVHFPDAFSVSYLSEAELHMNFYAG
jgi:hypothetical protein